MNDLERVARKIHEHSGNHTPWDALGAGQREKFKAIAREVFLVLNHPLPPEELKPRRLTRFPTFVTDPDDAPVFVMTRKPPFLSGPK